MSSFPGLTRKAKQLGDLLSSLPRRIAYSCMVVPGRPESEEGLENVTAKEGGVPVVKINSMLYDCGRGSSEKLRMGC